MATLGTYNGISFDSLTKTYMVDSGAAVRDINTVIRGAADGSTIYFSAGTHTLDEPLYVTRDNITIKGAGKELTTFSIDLPTPGIGFNVKGGMDSTFITKLAADTHLNDHTIVLQNTNGLKAGDILEIEQANDAKFLSNPIYELVRNNENMPGSPLRQSLAEIESVNGNIVTLKHAIAYDMEAGQATVQRMNMLENVRLEGFTVTHDLGLPPPNPDLFENTLTGWNAKEAMSVRYTHGIEIKDVGTYNVASHGLDMREALEPHVDGFSSNGAYNKGDNSNGYGLHIGETFYGTFENITGVDVRHGFIFSSWSAEAYNNVHVAFTNRDINYHGSDDHDNTVVVDRSVYEGSDEENWSLISPGNPLIHPYTDISRNTNLFGYASGGIKADTVTGWDNGAELHGNRGNDTLTGGAGNDLIDGGADNDTLTGKAGSDRFLHRAGDGHDIITDFQTGAGGDVLILSNYYDFRAWTDVQFEQSGSDARLYLASTLDYSDSITLKNVNIADLTADNFAFQASSSGLQATLSKTSDFLLGSKEADTVSTYLSNLAAGDILQMGNGSDILKFISVSFTFDTRLLPGLNGIDIVDMSDTSSGKVTFDDRFVDASDANAVTLRYGAATLTRLDTSGVAADKKVLLDGSGTVNLAYDAANRVTVTAATKGTVNGGYGDDYFTLYDSTAGINGGRGNDTFAMYAYHGRLDGGDGDDAFYFTRDGLNGALEMDGGAGFDELRFARAVSISAADTAQVSGIDSVRFYVAGNDFALTDSLVMDGKITLLGNKAMADVRLDVSAMTEAATINIDRSLAVTVTGAASAQLTYNLLDKANAPFFAGDGSDRINGGKAGDTINAGGGDDIISGGKGNDTLAGGAGRDTFVMTRDDGNDTIADFQAGNGGDRIALKSFYQYGAFSDLVLQQSGSDVRLMLSATDSIVFKNTVAGDFTADNFTFDNTAKENLLLRATSGADLLITGSGADVAEVFSSTFKADDVLNLGTGLDTLKLMTSKWDFNSNIYATIKGVETLDMTAVTTPSQMVIGYNIAAGSDTGKLTVLYGASGIGLLDTSKVDTADDVSLKGSGLVTLADAGNRISLETGTGMFIQGGAGNDYIKVRGGEVTINGGAGDDTVSVGVSGTYRFNGGAGNDSFLMSSSSFLKGNVFDGGTGIDELRLYDKAVLNDADLSNITHFERIVLYADNNSLDAIGGIFDDRIEFKGNSGKLNLDLDISNMSDSQVAIFGENLLASLTGDANKTYHLETTSKFNGELHATQGNDIIVGNTGVDTLYGEGGNDVLTGAAGNDRLDGGAGNDVLTGGMGTDRLTGGGGADTFRYADYREGGDVITDFNMLEGDKLDLTALFAANGLGAKGTIAALAEGYLTLTLASDGVNVGFDRDGALKSSYASVTLATLQGHDLLDINLTAIMTS